VCESTEPLTLRGHARILKSVPALRSRYSNYARTAYAKSAPRIEMHTQARDSCARFVAISHSRLECRAALYLIFTPRTLSMYGSDG
jgi:hypothetical protein